MKANTAVTGWKLTDATVNQTNRLHEIATPYGSYTELKAVRALIIVGLMAICGLTLLVALVIV